MGNRGVLRDGPAGRGRGRLGDKRKGEEGTKGRRDGGRRGRRDERKVAAELQTSIGGAGRLLQGPPSHVVEVVGRNGLGVPRRQERGLELVREPGRHAPVARHNLGREGRVLRLVELLADSSGRRLWRGTAQAGMAAAGEGGSTEASESVGQLSRRCRRERGRRRKGGGGGTGQGGDMGGEGMCGHRAALFRAPSHAPSALSRSATLHARPRSPQVSLCRCLLAAVSLREGSQKRAPDAAALRVRQGSSGPDRG